MLGFDVFIYMSFCTRSIDAFPATPYTIFFGHFGTNLTFNI